jgi:hypothetical protein
MLAAIVAGFVVPVGFALSPEYEMVTRTQSAGFGMPSATAIGVPILLGNKDLTFAPLMRPIPDAAKLLLVGTVLIGLSGAVRKGR